MASDADSYGRLIPEIDNVDTMTAETGDPVNFTLPTNMQWFEMHKESIFKACYKRVEEEDDYDD